MSVETIKDRKDKYMYFLYSEQQEEDNRAIEESKDSTYITGKVIVNGRRRNFTEMTIKPTNRYDDAQLVAEGYQSHMTFTPVYRSGKRR